MYPRNAASPPRIAIGAVVQISDGAVQSSGVSVVVRAEGGSETAGGGTVSYGASSNVVYYAPTQAETNYTAFVVTAYKTGCVPVSVTVVTTESATAGRTYVGTNGDKTGYALTSGERDAIAAAIEAAILDEGDATALLAAISAKVEEFLINEGDATATLAAIAAAVRTNLATELGRIDVAVSTRASTGDLNLDGEGYPQVNAVKLGGTDVQELTDPIPASLDAVLGTALTEGAAGRLAAALKAFLDVAVPVLTTASVNQTADAPTAAAIADKILGRAVAGGSDGGRTVSAYLQGFANKVETSADGLTVTIYASDDTTVLQTLDATRLATSVGGLRSVTPE